MSFIGNSDKLPQKIFPGYYLKITPEITSSIYAVVQLEIQPLRFAQFLFRTCLGELSPGVPSAIPPEVQ